MKIKDKDKDKKHLLKGTGVIGGYGNGKIFVLGNIDKIIKNNEDKR